jgi:glycosyltransferase involved in cell wall biosynthesis
MKIAVLSTYPVAPARHGGQHRVANMIGALEAAGHDVQSVGVLGSDSYAATPGFLPFPGHNKLRHYIENPFLMEDWAIGRLAAGDPATFKALSQLIDKNVDAIFCEHPWLFGFALKYRQGLKGKKKPLLVYESHNVESDLKQQIIKAYYGSSYAATCQDLILQVEEEAIQHSDLISAVSQSDAEWIRKLAKVPIIVAPNGVGENRASVQDVVDANAIVGHRKFALYVASGHPPNVFGFYDLFGAGVGCIGPEDRMVVAGAAGHSIRIDEKFDRVAGLSRSFVDAGMVSDGALRGLLQAAHCIFLPMKSGGGTNLKTAEALWSGRPVIATTHAMRGFEQYCEAPGVHVAKDRADFLAGIQRAMAAERFEIDQMERLDRRSLLWDETLKPMIRALDERPKQDG